MNKNISRFCGFFLLLFFVTGGALKSSAQESGSPSFEAYDKLSIDDFNTRDSTFANQPRKDSSAVRLSIKRNVYKPAPVAPKEKDSSGDPNDNSVLSFNFLYYLIQKYKMQDIVD
jgi:hypothetical protein